MVLNFITGVGGLTRPPFDRLSGGRVEAEAVCFRRDSAPTERTLANYSEEQQNIHSFIFQQKSLFSDSHLLKLKCLRKQNKLPRDY